MNSYKKYYKSVSEFSFSTAKYIIQTRRVLPPDSNYGGVLLPPFPLGKGEMSTYHSTRYLQYCTVSTCTKLYSTLLSPPV